jgi:hypothetical protein
VQTDQHRIDISAFGLTGGIVVLSMATAFVHFTLGGLLFLLNAAGYVGLAGLIVVGAAVRRPIVRRFSWFPRLALAGFTATTIVGFLVIGPYITLGWITKGVEVALVTLLALDVRRVYGGPRVMLRQAVESVVWLTTTIRRAEDRRWGQQASERRAGS